MCAGTARGLGRQPSLGRLVLVLVVVSTVGLALAPAADAATLVPPLHAVPGSRARALSVGPGRALLRLPRAAVLDAQGVAGRGALGAVRIYGFELSRERQARHVLAAWLASQRRARLRPRRARVGDGGWTVTGGRGTIVGWRSGPDVGLVVAPGRRRLSGALAYASLEQATLAQSGRGTAWERVLDDVGLDGTLSKTVALRAFALAYSRPPGVPIVGGGRRAAEDSTAVAQWVLRYRSRLTAAQRRIIDRALGVGHLPRARRARAAAANFGDPGFVQDAGYQAIVDGWRSEFDQKIDPLPAGVQIVAGRTSTAMPGAAADALPLNDQQDYRSGNYRYCRIRVGASGQGDSQEFRTLFLAHEVFHCFQFAFWGNGRWSGHPLWLQEGMADWAALEIDPTHWTNGGGNLTTYIVQPDKPLFERAYDAVGFFAHVKDTRGDFWQLVKPTLQQTSNPQAFVAAGGADAQTFPTWGSSVFRLPDNFPLPWRMIDPIADTPRFVALEPGGIQTITNVGVIAAYPYATAQAVVNMPGADLIHVRIAGTGRMLSNAGESADVRDRWLCVTTSCTCPPGSTGAVPQSTKWEPKFFLAVSGDPDDGSGGFVEAHELSEFCRAVKPPAGGGGGGGGPPGGGSNGDPHLRTFDGQRYEFQALGEFVLARSTLGGFEVQARQERIQHSFLSSFVSVNTQLAFRIGRGRVTISRGDPLVVRLGGRRIHPERGAVRLTGGGAIGLAAATDPCDGLDLRWPDGSRACVWSVGDYGVAIWLTPAAHLRGHLLGLLGNFNATVADDFRTRQGRLFAVDQVAPDRLKSQYRNRYYVFGESWRVRSRESLVDYARGQRTATFTDRRFPKGLFPVDRLSAGVRARAEAVCKARGITDPDIFEACVLDVAATGSDAFADSAKTEEQASAVSTPWQPLAGLSNEDLGPAAVAATADGVLHVAVIGADSRNSGQPGNYLETTLDQLDRQGPVVVDQPATLLQYSPLLAIGPSGLQLLGFTDIWPGGAPGGVSSRGLMSWRGGAVSDWLPGAHGPATSFAQTADGTPYTVTVAVNNFQLWRGSGAAAVAHQPAMGAFCFDHSDQVASDGQTVWLAWLQINCADQSQNGLYVAPVSTATGEVGTPQQVPRPGGASWANYDSSEPLAFVSRPGNAGAWLAYALQVGGVPHGFLLHAGDTTAIDLGPVSSPRLLTAATASGALWVGAYDNHTPRANWLLHFRRFAAGGVAQPGTWTVLLPSIASGAQAGPGSVVVAARGERLDLVATFDGSPNGTNGMVWHTGIG